MLKNFKNDRNGRWLNMQPFFNTDSVSIIDFLIFQNNF